MNKVYRSIWNESLGAWVAASEISRSCRKSSRAVVKAAVLLMTGLAAAVSVQAQTINACALTGATDNTTCVPTPGMVVYNTAATTGANGLAVGAVYWNGNTSRWLPVATQSYFNVNSTASANQNLQSSGASGAGSMAAGPAATATGTNSMAVGNGATAGGGSATAIGSGATTSANNTIALGAGANASGDSSSAIGAGAKAGGQYAVALGFGAAAGTGWATAIGKSATASGASSPIAVGSSSLSSGQSSIAIGDWATATGLQAVAIGAKPSGANAAGGSTYASGNQSTAVGYLAQATNTDAVALGASATATGQDSLAAGTQATASGQDSTAIGRLATAPGQDNVSIGRSATTGSGGQAVSVGTNSSASTQYGTSVGNFATTKGQGAVAVGGGGSAGNAAQAGDTGAIAIGGFGVSGFGGAQATATYAIAAGSGSVASKDSAIAIGKGAQAAGSQSISIGTGNKVQADRSGAIGDPTTIIASATDSYSIGNTNTVNTADTFVMGNGVTTAVGNSIYLGKGAAADGTTSTPAATAATAGMAAYASGSVNGTTYNYAGATPTGVVTVGAPGAERRIQNVSAGMVGPNSTDAVNGSQLYATNQAIVAAQTHDFSVKSATPASDTNYNNTGAAGANSLAAGVNASAGGGGDTAVGYGASAIRGDGVAIGTNAKVTNVGAVNDTSGAAGVRGVAIGLNSTATVASSIAIGSGALTQNTLNATSSPINSIAIGTGSAAMGSNTVAIGAGSGTGGKGSDNVAVGINAGQNVAPVLAANNGGTGVAGSGNSAFGPTAGNNVTGSGNTALGSGAGQNVGPITDATSGPGSAYCLFPTYYCYGGGGNGANNLAVGPSAANTVAGAQNIGVGFRAGSFVTGNNNMAMGQLAGFTVNGSGNAAVGSFAGAYINGFKNTAIGNAAGMSVTGSSNAAVGDVSGSTVAGSNNAALGTGAGSNIVGSGNVAVGQGAGALLGVATNAVSNSVSVGNVATSYGNNSIAMGTSAQASGVYGAILSGNQVVQQTPNSSISDLAIGNRAQALGGNSIAQGSSSAATGSGNIALGQNALAGKSSDLASLNAAIATLQSAGATYNQAFASYQAAHPGASTASTLADPTVSAALNAVKAQQAVVDGLYASMRAGAPVNAIAIGSGAQAQGNQSISIGTGNVVTGNRSGAIGDPNYVGSTDSYVLGNNNIIGPTSNNVFIVGNGVNIGATSVTVDPVSGAVTYNGQSNVSGAVALGNASGVAVQNGVALGSSSQSNTGAGMAGYNPVTGQASTAANPTWQSTLGAVSVGVQAQGAAATQTRQITGVAAGTQATDAVNVAQLQAAQTHYYSVNDTGANRAIPLGSNNFNNDGAGGTNALAAGVGAYAMGSLAFSSSSPTPVTYANPALNTTPAPVLGSLAVGSYARTGTGNPSAAVGPGAYASITGAAFGVLATATGSGATAFGSGAPNSDHTQTIAAGQNSTAIATGARALGARSTAIGDHASANNFGGVALGMGSVSNRGASIPVAITANSASNAPDASAAAWDPVTGVAAVSGSAIYNTNSTIGAVSVGGTPSISPLANSADAGGMSGKPLLRQITSLAGGSQDTDAVNVAQLKAVAGAANAGWNIGNDTAQIAAAVNSVGPGARVDFVSSAPSASNVQVTQTSGVGPTKTLVTVAASPTQYTSTNIASGGNTPSADQFTATDQLTLVGAGGQTNAGVTINNVAPGAVNNTSLQAINGSQLYGTANSVASALGGGSAVNTNGTVSAPSYTITNPSTNVSTVVKNVGDALTNLNTAVNQPLTFAGDSGTNVTRPLGSTLNVTGGATGALTTGNIGVVADNTTHTLSVQLAKDLQDLTSITTTDGAGNSTVMNSTGTTVTNAAGASTVTSATGVTITPAAGGGNPVSLTTSGLNNGGNTITNVGPGVNGTDAVNVNQLNAVSTAANAGWNVTANGAGSTTANIGPNGKVTFNGDSNITATQTGTANDGQVNVTLNKDITLDSVTTGNTVLNTSGVTITGGPNGTVSLGNSGLNNGGNVITGVAAGTQATDAVNVSQLSTVVGSLGGGAQINPDGTVTGPTYTTSTGSYTNVGAALTAANTQTNTLGSTLASGLGGGSTYNPATGAVTTVLNVGGNTFNNVNDALNNVSAAANAGWNVTTGTVAGSTGTASGTSVSKVAPGTTATFSAGNNIAITQNGTEVQIATSMTPTFTTVKATDGAGNTTTMTGTGVTLSNGTALTNSGLNVAGGSTVNMGGNRVTNVGAGIAPTDAVNVSQLAPVVAGLGGGATVNPDGTVTGPTYTITATNGSTSTVNNVGSALTALNEQVIKPLTTTGNVGSAQTRLGESIAIRGDATTAGTYSGANVNTVVSGNTVNVQIADAPRFGTVTINDGGSGRITGVAPGVAGTDAANVNQINAVGASTASALGGTSAYNPTTQTVTAGLAVGGTTYNNVQDALNNVSTVASEGWYLGANGSVVNVRPGGTLQMVNGSNTTVSLSGNQVQVNVVPNPTFTGTVTAAGGINMGGTRITNLAPGAIGPGSTDAVNGAQLYQTNTAVVQTATAVQQVGQAVQSLDQRAVQYQVNADGTVNYGQATLNGPAYDPATGQGGTRLSNVADGTQPSDAVNVRQFSNGMAAMNNRIDGVAKDARAGTAAAMAVAGLPQAYVPGKSMLGAALAGYRGQSALAVGVTAISDNGKWVVKGAVTRDTRGSTGAVVGAGFQW